MHYIPGKIAIAPLRLLRGSLWGSSIPLMLLAASLALASCERPQTAPEGEAAPVEEPLPTTIATVQAIVAEPVWVTPAQGTTAPAQVSQALAYGDRIRTADQALAEVGLVTGPVFRIGGNASLTLRPSQLQLSAGQMITWVEGTGTEPVEIVTTAGIAGIRGTTVFVNIADDPTAPVEFFSWEGQVAFRLTDGGEEIILNSGEQLFVSPDDTDIDALRQRVQPLDRATALQRLENSRLINGFSRPMPTRSQIEATVDALE